MLSLLRSKINKIYKSSNISLSMVEYNLGTEVVKIKESFIKVKGDINALRDGYTRMYNDKNSELKQLREEVKYLKSIIFAMQNKDSVIEKKEIVGNKDSKKFHYSDCPYGKKINIENKIVFKNIEDAVKHGYDECVCIVEKKNN